jgi:hypothetical protein
MNLRNVVGAAAAALVVLLLALYLYWSLVYVDESNLLTFGSPEGLSCFAVVDAAGSPVWTIEAPQPRSIDAIRYGQVPAGFIQAVPSVGSTPRDLRRGEVVTLRAEAVTRYQEHQCTATDAAAVSCGTYIQGPVPDLLPGQAAARACRRTRGIWTPPVK